MQNISCCFPNVIFNRSAVKFIYNNGYYYKRRYERLTTDEKINFDFSRFNPYKMGCLKFASPDEFKKPLMKRRFLPVDNVIDNYYTYDFEGNKVPLFLKVPCGHCDLCQHKKVNAISTQLLLESQCYDYMPLFFTLTYRDEYKPNDGVNKEHIQNFLKRLRNNLNQQFRYFIVSEYGTKSSLRPHYHGIIFGLKYDYNSNVDLDKIHNAFARAWSFDRRVSIGFGKDETEKIYFMNRWQDVYKRQYGIIDVQPTNGRAFKYVSKYILKKNNVPEGQNLNFVLRSNRYGIGFKYDNASISKTLNSNSISMTIYNKWSSKLQDVVIPSAIRKKFLPCTSRYTTDRLRDVINNVNFYLSELFSYNYTFIRQMHEEFCKFNDKLGWLGYYVAPLEKMKMTLCHTYPNRWVYMRDFLPFGDNPDLESDKFKYYHPRMISFGPRKIYLLIRLKNFMRVLEDFSSRFDLTAYLRNFHTKQNINDYISKKFSHVSETYNLKKICMEKEIFLANCKI